MNRLETKVAITAAVIQQENLEMLIDIKQGLQNALDSVGDVKEEIIRLDKVTKELFIVLDWLDAMGNRE